MLGAILFGAILFAVVSTFKYYRDTDATKSVPERVVDAVKMGAVAVVGFVTAAVMHWSNQ